MLSAEIWSQLLEHSHSHVAPHTNTLDSIVDQTERERERETGLHNERDTIPGTCNVLYKNASRFLLVSVCAY